MADKEEPEELDDEEMGEFEDDEFEEGIDMGELLTSLLTTEDGDNVCTALVTIGKQLETQNKILVKMLSKMSAPPTA
jgi:hypothetical protein